MSKINISLNDKFLKKLDLYSCKENKTRSGFVREAVENYIADIEEENKLKEKKKRVQQAKSLFREFARKNKGWDGVSEINKWRDRK
jgi:metal-responsive CopG/Arc/MetJ family transcriptional regulator